MRQSRIFLNKLLIFEFKLAFAECRRTASIRQAQSRSPASIRTRAQCICSCVSSHT